MQTHSMLIPQTFLKHNTQEMLQILFCLLCIKYIFFWFYGTIGFRGNIKYAKKGIMSTLELCENVLMLQLSLSLHDK